MTISTIIYIVIGVVVLSILIGLFAMGYVIAPPNKAVVITGSGKQRVLLGQSGWMIPFLTTRNYVSVEQFSTDVKTSDFVPTKDFINVKADAAVKLKIGTSEEMLAKAAENFLNWDTERIASSVQDVLEGNLREVIGQMELRKMVNDRQEFANKVQENVAPDLAKMGIEVIAFTVQSFYDANEVINDLGINNVVAIQKDAANSRAKAEREMAEVKAREAQLANDAEIASQLEISRKKNDLSIEQARLKAVSDKEIASAGAVLEIENQIQRKEIERQTAEADIVRQEQEARVKEKEVEVKRQSLAASVMAEADAEKYAAEKRAEADLVRRQRAAEAELFETQKESEAQERRAQAARKQAEEEAKGIEAKGRAEAEAIRLRLEAEADGLDKKAEALAKMDKAGIAQMYFEVLPSVVAAAAKPLENVGNITMYGSGNGSKLVGDIMTSIDQINQGSGLNVQALISGLMGANVTGAAIGRQIANHSNESGESSEISKDSGEQLALF